MSGSGPGRLALVVLWWSFSGKAPQTSRGWYKAVTIRLHIFATFYTGRVRCHGHHLPAFCPQVLIFEAEPGLTPQPLMGWWAAGPK